MEVRTFLAPPRDQKMIPTVRHDFILYVIIIAKEYVGCARFISLLKVSKQYACLFHEIRVH